MELFTWPVQAGLSKRVSFRKGRNDFGDGYTQHYSLGINPRARTWDVTILEDETVRLIEDFIDRHKGVQPFLWMPPNSNEQVAVICEGYNTSAIGYTTHNIGFTFEEYQKP